jgi:hypothetical protein
MLAIIDEDVGEVAPASRRRSHFHTPLFVLYRDFTDDS